MSGSLKQKTIKGTWWSSIERFSVQGVNFIVMIIMARILTPEDYGVVGMLTIFIAVSQTLVDSGFSQALIRKLDRNQVDNSTVFWFNLVVSVALYFILFFCAPVISRFYNEPLLVPLTRVISLSLIVNGLVVVQRALFTVRMDFKNQAKASLSGVVAGGGLGIYLAYTGHGVWAIVWGQLATLGIQTGGLWVMAKWRPSWSFSKKSFRSLFGFGSKLAVSAIIETLYQNSYLLVIGKIFKADDLGYYTRANQFAAFPSSNITAIIQRVTYPALCSLQEDMPRLTDVYIKILRLAAFIIFPLMIGLAVVAQPLIILVLGEKWDFAASLLSVLCLAMMWYPVHALNLNLLQVLGRSDLFLKLEIWKKIVGVAILVASVPLGIEGMCWGLVVSSVIALFINIYYSGKLVGLGFLLQMKELLPFLVYSVIMGLVVGAVVFFIPGEIYKLFVGVLAGLIVYYFLTKLTGCEELQQIFQLKDKLVKQKN